MPSIPMSAHRRAVLKANPAPMGAHPDAIALFPKAWRIVKESVKVSTLPLKLTRILGAGNLREAVAHRSAKKGRDPAREVATVGFQRLRHSPVSLLKAAGVPDAPFMTLVEHETLAMSSHYTHVGKESLESAVASLPSFGPAPLSK